MEWIKVTVEADPPAEETVSNILMEMGAQGVEIQGNQERLAQEVPVTWDIEEVLEDRVPYGISAYYAADGTEESVLAGIQERLDALRCSPEAESFGALRASGKIVKDEDWATSWKEYFRPVRASDFIVIKPSWCEYEKEAEEQVVIDIDPGMAFGTGNHETTRLALGLLEQFLCPDDTVIDVGCGSGVLALAAAKLGAGHVYALDMDPAAVKATAVNAQSNGVSEKVSVLNSNLFSGLPKNVKADMIVANIIADVLIRMAPQVPSVLRKNGMFLCSGTIMGRQNDVISAFAAVRMRIIRIVTEGEWVGMAFKYKQ